MQQPSASEQPYGGTEASGNFSKYPRDPKRKGKKKEEEICGNRRNSGFMSIKNICQDNLKKQLKFIF